MRRRLPPLNALRAFEAAARHESLSQAARELGVAHSAVGRHVVNLEAWLGVELFQRQQHKLKLTLQGAVFVERLTSLFDQMQEATAACVGMKDVKPPLRVGVHPTFAIRLLIPLLADFQQSHPEITVHIESSHSVMDPTSYNVDASVLVGDGTWPGLHAERLFAEELVPVASPALLEGRKLKRPSDLKAFQLLHALRRPLEWPSWLKQAGITDMAGYRELSLDYSGLVLEGAVNGLGVALAQPQYVANELENRRLIRLFPQSLRTGRGYYFVYPAGRAGERKILRFGAWLVGRLAAPGRRRRRTPSASA